MTEASADTIYALSSGSPPAAIAVIRISGARAGQATQRLAGRLPEPRHATYRAIKDPQGGELLDRALLLWFPGPATATGEDLAELHLHGGRAVVAGVLAALQTIDGLRPAEAGEFTRRAFENGRIDLAEAEGLADLLEAETRSQRVAALQLAGGALSRQVEQWQSELLRISAGVEAVLDFSDEDDVADESASAFSIAAGALAGEIGEMLSRPAAERLKDGITIALAGPVNAGKSSLINALSQRDVAITSSIPGTTRDLIEVPVSIGGVPFRLIDTAGLRTSADEIEAIGVERARRALETSDIILWLGDAVECPDPNRALVVASKLDIQPASSNADVQVSAATGEGLDQLVALITARAAALLPAVGEVAINERHRRILAECQRELVDASFASDLLIVAEHLRLTRVSLDMITGRAGVEDLLDGLFGRFCIGK